MIKHGCVSSEKAKAFHPTKMDTSSGKSIHHSHLLHTLSNTTREQLLKALRPNHSVFSLGKSTLHSRFLLQPFSSKSANRKQPLSCLLRPISIHSNAGASSMTHLLK